MNVAHHYHIFAGGSWRMAVGEHLAALEDSRFDGTFHVGIVGPEEQRSEVVYELNVLRPPDSIFEAETGWEQFTLQRAHSHAKVCGGAVMYAHTKGAANASPFQEQWRRWMTWNVINEWRPCRHALTQGYDAVGCHWLTAEEFPHVKVDTDFPMFGGNFWMATCEYLRKLPPVGIKRRHEAESWIGLASPRVMDLSPGWPGSWPYPNRPMRRLVVGR